jgi:hypothetical protein
MLLKLRQNAHIFRFHLLASALFTVELRRLISGWVKERFRAIMSSAKTKPQ